MRGGCGEVRRDAQGCAELCALPCRARGRAGLARGQFRDRGRDRDRGWASSAPRAPLSPEGVAPSLSLWVPTWSPAESPGPRERVLKVSAPADFSPTLLPPLKGKPPSRQAIATEAGRTRTPGCDPRPLLPALPDFCLGCSTSSPEQFYLFISFLENYYYHLLLLF